MRGFLAHHRERGLEGSQRLGQHRLGRAVGHGDDVAGGLGLDLVFGETAIERQDRLLAHPPHQREQFAVKHAHECPFTSGSPR